LKGDFSKIRRAKKQEREKNYKKVLLQQGRVLTDADWNEQVDIQDSYETTALKDIIGKNGIPLEEKDSFKITPTKGGNTFAIGKGRMYVDGKLIENFRKVGNYTFSSGEEKLVGQPYLPTTVTKKGQPTSDAIPKEPGMYLAYLKVFDRPVTYLEDPDIQESALGDSDTSLRVQTVWQVLLHKLEDGEIPNENQGGENKWAPWIPLGVNDAENNGIASDIRIDTDNQGELLEVFAVSKLPRISIRQTSSDPVEWEDTWSSAKDTVRSDEFDIAAIQGIDLKILHTFGIEHFNNKFNYYIRDDESRWGSQGRRPGPPGEGNTGVTINQIRLVKDAKTNLHAFAFSTKHRGIVYSKQDGSLNWDVWRGASLGGRDVAMFSVILNPNNNCLEVYTTNGDGQIFYTRQKQPDTNEWIEWKKISDGLIAIEIAVVLNKDNQVVIFAKDRGGELWSTIKKGDSVENPWDNVGANKPGNMLFHSGALSVLNNPKSDRLEVFGIFSDLDSDELGAVWNITEDDEGKWGSDWKIINENQKLRASRVTSIADKKGRVNIFAIAEIEGPRRIVHHSYLEDQVVGCQFEIQSWKEKTKPSTWQLSARARPHAPQPDDPCLLPEQAGYRGLENQLYRIEIHEPKTSGKNATFKYSRDNGTLCSNVLSISGNKIAVASLGKDKLLTYAIGQWVEINDEQQNLRGERGVLVRISEIDLEGKVLTFDRKIPASAKVDNDSFPRKFKPKVRRWDSPKGALEVEDGWIDIEKGIEIKFKHINKNTDVAKTGDYCTFAARTLKGDIEWPKGPDGLPEFVEIDGIQYHYAKLALLEYTGEELRVLSDCRDFFPPLNTLDDLSTPQPKPESKSIISWTHGVISQVTYPERVTPPVGLTFKANYGTAYTQKPTGQPGFNQNKFHLPMTISYPIESDKKVTLQSIHLRYQSNSNTIITDVFISDGFKLLKEYRNLSYSGSHGTDPDAFNTFSLAPGIEVKQGVSIMINVSFPSSGNSGGTITFYGAGAQFKID
jgi:hypothetical protein